VVFSKLLVEDRVLLDKTIRLSGSVNARHARPVQPTFKIVIMEAMYRLASTIILSSVAFAQKAPDAEIVRAAKSPYDLARYIDSHPGADMTAVWRAMSVTGAPSQLARCDVSPGSGPCEIEVITILKPSQVILLLQGEGWDNYLRFLEDGPGWRFAGHFSANLKNFPRRHEIIRIGDKPFLTTSIQGASGTGIDSEYQAWFDLSQPGLDRVFGFTVQGEQFGGFIRRAVRAEAYPYKVGLVEGIKVNVEVDFSLEDIHLDSSSYAATYERGPSQRAFSLRSVDSRGQNASISTKEFEALANINVDGLTDDEMLAYALPGLKKVASSRDSEAKSELRMMLEYYKDTLEKRTLLDLLGKP
jgi:hypothetical protein